MFEKEMRRTRNTEMSKCLHLIIYRILLKKKIKNFTKISQLTFITRRKVKYIILDK